jgi:hypothetical protein
MASDTSAGVTCDNTSGSSSRLYERNVITTGAAVNAGKGKVIKLTGISHILRISVWDVLWCTGITRTSLIVRAVPPACSPTGARVAARPYDRADEGELVYYQPLQPADAHEPVWASNPASSTAD